MKVRTHTDHRPPLMQPHPLPLQALPTPPHDPTQPLIKRHRKRHMRHHAALKERKRPNPLRPVDNLVRHHEIPWFHFLRQRADSAEGDDGADAEGAEGGDVGAGGDFVGCEGVVEAVAGEEGDGVGVGRVGGGGVGEDGDGG